MISATELNKAETNQLNNSDEQAHIESKPEVVPSGEPSDTKLNWAEIAAVAMEPSETKVLYNGTFTGVSGLLEISMTSVEPSVVTTESLEAGVACSRPSNVISKSSAVRISTADSSGVAAESTEAGIASTGPSDVVNKPPNVGITTAESSGVAAESTEAGVASTGPSDVANKPPNVDEEEEIWSEYWEMEFTSIEYTISSNWSSRSEYSYH